MRFGTSNNLCTPYNILQTFRKNLVLGFEYKTKIHLFPWLINGLKLKKNENRLLNAWIYNLDLSTTSIILQVVVGHFKSLVTPRLPWCNFLSWLFQFFLDLIKLEKLIWFKLLVNLTLLCNYQNLIKITFELT